VERGVALAVRELHVSTRRQQHLRHSIFRVKLDGGQPCSWLCLALLAMCFLQPEMSTCWSHVKRLINGTCSNTAALLRGHRRDAQHVGTDCILGWGLPRQQAAGWQTTCKLCNCFVTLTTPRRLKPTATPSGVMPRLSLPLGSHFSCTGMLIITPLRYMHTGAEQDRGIAQRSAAGGLRTSSKEAVASASPAFAAS
jgi:hypothetical protein